MFRSPKEAKKDFFLFAPLIFDGDKSLCFITIWDERPCNNHGIVLFFKFYLACYNFFASYTCVILFFYHLLHNRKKQNKRLLVIGHGQPKKLNDYLYRVRTTKVNRCTLVSLIIQREGRYVFDYQTRFVQDGKWSSFFFKT